MLYKVIKERFSKTHLVHPTFWPNWDNPSSPKGGCNNPQTVFAPVLKNMPPRPREKNPVLRANRFQKAVGRSGEFFFFFYFFFYRTDLKSACKSKNFPLTSLTFFRTNFCSKKWLILLNFFVKKKRNSANGQKSGRSGPFQETVFIHTSIDARVFSFRILCVFWLLGWSFFVYVG